MSAAITSDDVMRPRRLPGGAYRRRVRTPGIAPFEGRIDLGSRVDMIRVRMGSIRAALDSVATSERKRLLAAARARPRHWSCRTSEGDRRTTAACAFGAPSGGDYTKQSAIPTHRDTFFRGFQRIESASECRRLAVALDKECGLVDDDLVVFRVGACTSCRTTATAE
ncbi:MAG TPA: hypothetical protein VG432_10270 [Gemmatimonadaceae bacterium]|nr:hypothetical protein [Gemmatimonadaceae bacterium]